MWPPSAEYVRVVLSIYIPSVSICLAVSSFAKWLYIAATLCKNYSIPNEKCFPVNLTLCIGKKTCQKKSNVLPSKKPLSSASGMTYDTVRNNAMNGHRWRWQITCSLLLYAYDYIFRRLPFILVPCSTPCTMAGQEVNETSCLVHAWIPLSKNTHTQRTERDCLYFLPRCGRGKGMYRGLGNSIMH